MNPDALARRPLLLELNRVERFYTGGRLLDRWQGLPEEGDGHRSEEFLVSTTEYIGHSTNLTERGLSRTRLDDGSYVTIRELIERDERAMLGDRYAGKTSGQSGVLARIGDSTVRLVIQVHPDREGARKYLDFPSGKTEAWYILDSRLIDGVAPHVYCGFREGMTPERWRGLFDNQDIDGMLAAMHRLDVTTGDVILIPAGMPHAMGSGCLFLEIHEACDYTIRLEKTYLGRNITDEQLHYGMGFDAMFELFHYDAYTEDQIRAAVIMAGVPLESAAGGERTRLVSYAETDRFMVESVKLSGEFPLPEFDGHFIAITAQGRTELRCAGGRVTAPQGRGVFVPAGAGRVTAGGRGELVLAYPFKV